jgi:hypothetical protein
MAARAAGQSAVADEGLRRVIQSRTIDLVEVSMARDLLAPKLGLVLPEGVQLP